MRIVVIYESMFGNTRRIAEAIMAGLRDGNEALLLPVGLARPDVLVGADVVVVGGPTHVHGMSRASTRKSAAEMSRKPGAAVVLDQDAEGPGLREWLASLSTGSLRAAAFDTRMSGPAIFTGRASLSISRELRRRGCTVIAKPESFLVTKTNELRPGEEDRARRWGRQLASHVAAAGTSPVSSG